MSYVIHQPICSGRPTQAVVNNAFLISCISRLRHDSPCNRQWRFSNIHLLFLKRLEEQFMDVVNSVRDCLKNWGKGGDSECRNLLIAPHCNPSDPNCLDVLTTAYHTLLSATLLTWSPPHPLTPTAFADFVQSVLRSLPSSSSSSPNVPTHAAIFGDYLVDMIWALDLELEDLLNDARLAAASGDNKMPSSKEAANLINKARRAQQNAETDKQRIPVIVMKLLEYGIISPNHCRERLESTILASVGLIQDKTAQDKKEIRTRTGLFYKQNKFNLLREQSEGYSKLLVELTSNLGPPHSPQTGRPIESYRAIEERAKPVWEKVISLIGYFDLDPNRALDIILDVLSQHLTIHYTFFLALLSFSPWAGSYRRPLPDDQAMDVKFELPEGAFKGKTLDEVLTLAESDLKPVAAKRPMTGGARVLAQVLGFKFGHYQSADGPESTPASLYLTAAILIREGFIALDDLYPHLAPADDEMEKHRQKYLEDVKSRISGARNTMLAMAAPLESGLSQPKAAAPELKKTDSKSTNQKVGVLNGLLALGALKPAIAMLSKYPWLVDSNTEIADLMIRIVKTSIEPLYESLLIKDRSQSHSRPKARYGPSGLVYPGARKTLLTLWAPTPPSTNSTDFIFFYPDWPERVPICKTLDDLQDVIDPLLHFIGSHISRDPLFLTQFLRLGRLHLQTLETKQPMGASDPSHPISGFWFKVLRKYALPAQTLVRGSAVLTVEIWNIIRHYSTMDRWMLYGEWKSETYRSHPELRIREVQVDRESKGILRRLSLQTVDSLSGPVAKLAHSNPCIFFNNAVNQIMSYDNLANVVIQALRYVTNMGFDVLVFIILSALANPDKERVKDDGVNTSDWLQNLASFIGKLFRRYRTDLTPIIKYIVHQLHNGQTSEIVVLRELIWKMAGIEPLPTLTESQMIAMAGGSALRIEAIASETRGALLDPADANLKGPDRLGQALVNSSLALPLLIQIAQQRQACVFKASNTHIKSLASVYDATHGVLLQYLEFLTTPSAISPDDYAGKIIPPLATLGQDYGICAPICMQIIRPVLNATLLKSALAMQEQERIASEEVEKRLKATLTAKREPGAVGSRVASPGVGVAAIPEVKTTSGESEGAMDVDPTTVAVTTPQKEDSPWVPELAALFDGIKAIAPGNAYEVIGPGFYLTFWQLSMYDLAPPSSKYDEEGVKLRALSRQEDTSLTSAERSSDRAKRLTASSHRHRRDRYNTFINALAKEFKEQTVSRAFTIKRLAKEKQHWFAHLPKSAALINSIIEHCIQPRCLLSPMDADFCAQFIKVMHLQGTPAFHTLGCYDKLLGDHIKVVLFSCSEYEARNYGRFLYGILRDLLSWHLDESTYISENRTKVGGQTVILPGLQKGFTSNKIVPASVLKWPEFQQVVRKWHRKLAKSFIDCIQTGEFMHVYNAILVMKEVLDVFPLASVNESGPGINAAINRLVEIEERRDLKILALSYSASLKKKESEWAPSKPPSLANGVPSPRPVANPPTNPIPDKPRNAPPPTGPSAQSAASNDNRRPGPQPPASAPSAPRSQITNQNNSFNDKNIISSAKLAMESIPRPEVVKRVRPDVKAADSPKALPDSTTPVGEPTQSNDRKVAPGSSRDEPSLPSRPDINTSECASSRPPPREPSGTVQVTGSSKDQYEGSRLHRAIEQPQSRSGTPVMPPPAVPSQTASAQELRETARQTILKTDRSETRSRHGSAAPSPRVRSPSPPSRPGTRNPSNDSRTSRTSGGKSRSDPGHPDRPSDDRREREREREGRTDSREPNGPVSRRDSLTHNRSERSGRERSGRDGDKDREGDRDKDRGRDRHEREREKERDRERDRDRDRGDRERDRDRDNRDNRDRHRRGDDKDRDRESRKERESASSRSQAAPSGVSSTDDRGLPTRPDLSRNRNVPDESLGNKRRRPAEDDSGERNAKRSSRKEGSHRDDRSRRPPPEKEDRNRESSDRRRKDRDGPDQDVRTSSSDKSNDRRIVEGPSNKIVASAPSAPRAMDSSRAKVEPMNARDRHRDNVPSNKDAPTALGNGSSNQQESSRPSGSGSASVPVSLRSRIGDEAPLSFKEARFEDRDNLRKRSSSDREADNDNTSGPSHDMSVPSQKRMRPSPGQGPGGARNGRFGGHGGLARKILPIDHDKSSSRR